MNKKQSFMSLAAVLALASCSSDAPEVGNAGSSEDLVYMTFSLSADTRSTTVNDNQSSDGVEIGKDFENAINSVSVLLVNPTTGDVITNAQNITLTGANNKQTYSASFKTNELNTFAGQNVKVMVFCNMAVDATTYDEDLVKEGNSWGTNGAAGQFQMANADQDYVKELPADLSAHKSVDNPANLGTIYVERAAARMDLKKGGAANDSKYTLTDVENGEVTIEITDFALINMAPNWYALRRVSDPALDPANVLADPTTILCGPEKTNNFVISTNWNAKAALAGTAKFADYTGDAFVYPLATPTSWVWSSFSGLSNADNDDSWNNSGDKGNYLVWRYLNENTLPKNAQNHGVSTGVVFKGEITSNNTDIAAAMTAQEDIYVFQNTLYGNWERVVECAASNPALKVAVDNSYVTEGETTTFSATAAAEQGFSAYKADSDGKYYVYYYYWNRHNASDELLDTMEFGVVRNNVYKLCVTTVKKFGHPTPGDPDPDPVDPDDPDEDDETYFTVSLIVKPWVVRINNIEF